MRIDEYKNICDEVEVPEIVLSGYRKAISLIEQENIAGKTSNRVLKWSNMKPIAKVAVFVCAILAIGGGSVFTVRAYISHMERLRNLQTEEIVDLYESIFQYDAGCMSRGLSETEERRYANQYALYCADMTEPQGKVKIIDAVKDYSGKGIAFCKEDGKLYLPEKDLTDEELLQVVEFQLLRQFVSYDAYIQATNPLHYLNRYAQLSSNEVDEIYKEFYSANTETSFLSRELSVEEKGRRKILKDLYQKGIKMPEKKMTVIGEKMDSSETVLSFCTEDCTYYLPNQELSDEEILELIEHQMKAYYCWGRIGDEINRGLRADWPELNYIERDRIITLDTKVQVDDKTKNQLWIAAYSEVLKEYYQTCKDNYANPEHYYANVRFIYLNNDDIPEMLFSHGCTDFDYDDHCNTRVYLYTYKNGKAALLSPGEETIEDYYGYEKPFCYVERKGMVYCDYYYPYGFTTYDEESGIIDSVKDHMSRVDTWNLEKGTFSSTNSNIKMLHAKYAYSHEEYDDARFEYEYYVNVTAIIRNEKSGEIKKIVGEKVDQDTYERAERELWNEENFITLEVSDFDKIYCDDDLVEALARSYIKIK